MQAEAQKAKLDKQWQEELEKRKAEAEAERAKKAEKRNKKKQKRKNPTEDADAIKKQKLEEPEKNEIHKTAALPTEEEVTETAIEEPKAPIKQAAGIVLSDD